jgi:carboxymethylenebutenolidase
MRRNLVLTLLFPALCVLPLLGSQPARAGQMISLTQGSTKVSGYLSLPRGEGTHAALVVVQEWWGVTKWVKDQADSLARHGYVAFAVDLYDGKVAETQELAHQYANGLVEEDALRKLRAGADFLRSRDDVRANAIGAIGWCMGGKFAIRLAADDPGIRAVVMYYGAPLTEESQIKALQAAVLGNFGADDEGITPKDVKEFEHELREHGKRVDFKIYPGAPHAFANSGNPWGGYRPKAARDAWKRTIVFLDHELKRGSLPRHRAG